MQFGMQLCSASWAVNIILARQEEFPWCLTLNAATITITIIIRTIAIAGHLPCAKSSGFYHKETEGVLIICHLQRRKLKFREVKQLNRSHTASKRGRANVWIKATHCTYYSLDCSATLPPDGSPRHTLRGPELWV